jgi:Protein of unknown function VcgC/VcgE (DUF2780)
MPDTMNALSTETGLSTDLVHKGLGAILSFLKQHLGEDVFERIQSAMPDASRSLERFESSPESQGGGGLLGTLTGLAGRILGGNAGDAGKLLESFSKLGFTPEQIEAFLPRALAFIQSHLPADLIQQILAKLPALAQFAGAKSE